MATPRRLLNPPIKEALVDLRSSKWDTFEPAVLEPLWPQVRERFPKLEVRNKLKAQFERRTGEPLHAETKDLGFYGLFLTSDDDSRVAQFRVDGVTVSQLSGYTTADALFADALDLWSRYAELTKRESVERIALRYINRLVLPFKRGDDFDRFITAGPKMPDGMPQDIPEFVIRTVVQVQPETGTTAIITQRLEATTADGGPEGVPFVLDVDVFRLGEFPRDPDRLLRVLQELRGLKNQLFFGLVTDSALERYL